MTELPRKLVRDAQAIWHAGLAAVDSEKLVSDAVSLDGRRLRLGHHIVDLDDVRRIVVIGAGKAGAGMAAGLLDALGDSICREKKLSGWINVPDNCARELPWIRLFPARPPGENVPTPRVIEGTMEILARVRVCEPNDLCICLISGGGSALLDLPIAPITLDEQVALIEHLSSAQANIKQLNTVRKQISQVKAGRLAAACIAPMVTLIISDVLGDPLDVIASGPTVADQSDAAAALEVLLRFDPDGTRIASSIYQVLRESSRPAVSHRELSHVQNIVVGNLRIAIETAANRARALGYQTDSSIPDTLEGLADHVGHQLAERLTKFERTSGPQAWIAGGEPVVQLVKTAERGLGGRNQQVILAAAESLMSREGNRKKSFCALSGGTDGEDGPTDAAGAWMDSDSMEQARRLGLDPSHYLARNDAYHFFDSLGTLLRTGPTHTNVCDLRVLLCE